MAESFCWRGDDVTQRQGRGKAARLTGRSVLMAAQVQIHEKIEKNACQRESLSLN
ncbi:hypothetical protein YSA_02059 [Pseudomonas putida ND6]|uniref:Uncharacterized protein n=1 Tax=Pseudomonas putida ND6 TaxID=231023 RepID=I3UQW5_PSEPU|nr:hypothetical protein YSA_02059 [Pseudomonas putida ND6]